MCLPGYLELDADDFNHICAVHSADDAGDGSYIVEFKREQDAWRYLKAATKARKALAKSLTAIKKSEEEHEVPCGLEKTSPAAELLQSPPGLKPGTTSNTSNHREIQVIGLPKHLLSQKMMEATLEQAGLEKEVISITFSNPGKVHIMLSCPASAEVCLEHFHGRKWNPAGGAVTARIMPTKSASGKQGYPSKYSASKAGPGNFPGLDKFAPAYVRSVLEENPAHAHMKRVGTSDASTTVSDEDAEEESWEADMKKLMTGCAFE